MSKTEIEHARKRDDKKVVQSEYVNCPKCGHDEKIITYYDELVNDQTCTNCRHNW
jgi:hypothetical protein